MPVDPRNRQAPGQMATQALQSAGQVAAQSGGMATEALQRSSMTLGSRGLPPLNLGNEGAGYAALGQGLSEGMENLLRSQEKKKDRKFAMQMEDTAHLNRIAEATHAAKESRETNRQAADLRYQNEKNLAEQRNTFERQMADYNTRREMAPQVIQYTVMDTAVQIAERERQLQAMLEDYGKGAATADQLNAFREKTEAMKMSNRQLVSKVYKELGLLETDLKGKPSSDMGFIERALIDAEKGGATIEELEMLENQLTENPYKGLAPDSKILAADPSYAPAMTATDAVSSADAITGLNMALFTAEKVAQVRGAKAGSEVMLKFNSHLRAYQELLRENRYNLLEFGFNITHKPNQAVDADGNPTGRVTYEPDLSVMLSKSAQALSAVEEMTSRKVLQESEDTVLSQQRTLDDPFLSYIVQYMGSSNVLLDELIDYYRGEGKENPSVAQAIAYFMDQQIEYLGTNLSEEMVKTGETSPERVKLLGQIINSMQKVKNAAMLQNGGLDAIRMEQTASKTALWLSRSLNQEELQGVLEHDWKPLQTALIWAIDESGIDGVLDANPEPLRKKFEMMMNTGRLPTALMAPQATQPEPDQMDMRSIRRPMTTQEAHGDALRSLKDFSIRRKRHMADVAKELEAFGERRKEYEKNQKKEGG